LYGGITLFTAIGAVVDGTVVTCQTPLSGHLSPVRAVVPIGFLTFVPFRHMRMEIFHFAKHVDA
jgi:hypothetical protein